MQKSKVQFSVVMPIYNVAPYLEQSILCILNQTYLDFELILVNDASTDFSLEICRKFKKEEKVKIIDCSRNQGVSTARNLGLQSAYGEYILFIDPDDSIDLNLLEIYDQVIEKNYPDLVIVGAKEEYMNQNGKIEYEKVIIPEKSKVYDSQESIYEEALFLEAKTLFGYPWNKCYRTELLRKNGIAFKKVKMIEDIRFNLALLPYLKSMQTLSVAPYHYAIRPNASLTHQKLADYFELHTTRITLFIEEYERHMPELLPRCKETMAPIYCRYLLSAIARYEGTDIKKWLKSVYESELFNMLHPYMHFEGKKKWIYTPLVSRNIGWSIAAGKSAGFVKEKLPTLFAKAKQTR